MIDSGVSGPHPDHLDLLKQFSFRSDGRCNNDFRFLELSKIGGADISHTRRKGADQVLTSVVNVRWTEKDLPQWPSCSHSDAGAAGQVGVRSRHAPMVTFTRCLDRFCK